MKVCEVEMSIHEWIQKGAMSDEIAKKRGLKELVRCKDCKHAEVLKWLDDAIVCKKHNYTGVRPEEFFCADGERR